MCPFFFILFFSILVIVTYREVFFSVRLSIAFSIEKECTSFKQFISIGIETFHAYLIYEYMNVNLLLVYIIGFIFIVIS